MSSFLRLRPLVAASLSRLTLMLATLVASAVAEPESETVQAWRAFAGQLEAAGVAILESYPQPQPIDRAEALPYLLQQLSSAVTQTMERRAGQLPLLRLNGSTINKWGLDGADVKYLVADLDPGKRYRFQGTRGSATLLALQAVRLQAPYGAFASLTGDQLTVGDDGRIDVLLSDEKPADWQGDWLALNPTADSLLVREYFADWDRERAGRYALLPDEAVEAAGPLRLDQAVAQLEQTADTFASRAVQWQPIAERVMERRRNRVQLSRTSGQGLSTNFYGTAWFDVPSGMALLIEWQPPPALLWSVQLANSWWESIDYLAHLSSYNDRQAIADPDGVYRFVIAADDPGVANWLDPAGHREGVFLFRLQGAEAARDPVVSLVALDELPARLPADHRRMTPAQRDAALQARQRHAAWRWAP